MRGERLKQVCADHGLSGVFPLDPLDAEPAIWSEMPTWQRISRRNEAHILSCAALVANLTPFRGPSADVGTVFELGFMRALNRPVFGWSNTSVPFDRRTAAAFGSIDGRDAEGLAMEAFGCTDNLMIDGAIRSSGGALMLEEVPSAARWTALDAFEACVRACAAMLRQSG